MNYQLQTTLRNNLSAKFISNAGRISATFVALSIIYALYAISEDATENARVSENAMLVGLVDEAYHDAVQIQRYAQQLRNAVSKGQSLSDFIENELHRLRIEAYTHHYSCKTSSFSSSSSRRSGTNVYGIIRTFRSAPSEAILIVVPIKESHVDSISLALSFAKYTSQQTYWARNLIFLFVNAGSKLAAEAWIADYHGYSHPSFEPSGSDHFPHNVSDFGLPADGGAIIAAVAIDLVGTVFSQVEIQYGMINSRLPNMDLVAMFVSVIEKIGTRPVLYGFEHQRTSRNQIRYDYQTALKTIMTTIFYHGLIEYEGLGSLLGNYGISALTLKFRPHSDTDGDASTVINQDDAIRILEGGTRSLNNILEKFHHSYFLYLLPHPHKVITVSVYIPIIFLLASSIVVLGLREWMLVTEDKIKTISQALISVVYIFLFVSLFYMAQIMLHKKEIDILKGTAFDFTQKEITILSLLFIFLPTFWIFRIYPKTPSQLHCSRFLLSLNFVLFLITVSLQNFSLSILLIILLTPIVIYALNCSPQQPLWQRLFCFVLLNPITMAMLIFIVANNQPLLGCTRSPLLLDCLYSYCSQKLSSFAAGIVENHFAHSSRLLFVLTVPAFGIYLDSAQLLFSKLIN